MKLPRYPEMHIRRAPLRALHKVRDFRMRIWSEEETESGQIVTNGRSMFTVSVSVQMDTTFVPNEELTHHIAQEAEEGER